MEELDVHRLPTAVASLLMSHIVTDSFSVLLKLPFVNHRNYMRNEKSRRDLI
jgi:hypothetical protein